MWWWKPNRLVLDPTILELQKILEAVIPTHFKDQRSIMNLLSMDLKLGRKFNIKNT